MSTDLTVRRAPRLQPLGTAAKYVLLIVATALTLGPVIWTVIASLTPKDPATGVAEFGLGAYADVFTKVDFWLLVWNSVLVTGLVAAGQMVSAAMAGYVFARYEFRGKNLTFGIILATMMVPMQVTIVPVFMLVRGMGLADTLLALIIPALPTAFGTFLMRQYFMGMPPELGEASSGSRSAVARWIAVVIRSAAATPIEPARKSKSLAITATRRPLILPNPVTTPIARSDRYECWRNSSRACTLLRCTSTNGIATALNASRKAMLVWVNAPGLMMMASTRGSRAA